MITNVAKKNTGLRTFWNELWAFEKGFKPLKIRENNFARTVIIHSIAAIIITPFYTYFVKLSGAPELYFYLGISYSVLFPIYVLICWWIPRLRDKLIYFFIAHIFGLTYLAFWSLYNNGFHINELMCFTALFVIGVIVIQRWYFAVLYNAFVYFHLLYGFLMVEDLPVPKTLLATLYISIGGVGLLVLYARRSILKKTSAYAHYLKRVMDHTGTGYVLFDVEEEKVLDHNEGLERILHVTNKSELGIKNAFFSFFTDEDLEEIRGLKSENLVKKVVELIVHGFLRHVEMEITPIHINGEGYFVALVSDVTGEFERVSALELSEKKYKNLYYRNRAGVFTIDLKSKIIDANAAFFEMFEHTLSEGDRLFPSELEADWKMIVDSLGINESAKNYQTQLTLTNRVEKTFIFSWYLDNQTNQIEGSVIDLTETQKTAQALKQSEEKYRLIYEESNDAILLLSDDRIVDVNRRAIQLFGRSARELMEMDLYALSAQQNALSRSEYVEQKDKLNRVRNTKFEWLFSGTNRIIEAEVSFIEITLGKELFIQCVIHDNTELNSNLRAIENHKQNIENILENTPEGILIVRNKEILYRNPEMLRLVGTNSPFETFFSPEEQQIFKKAFDLHLRDGSRQNVQLTWINKEQQVLLLDITLVSTVFEDKEATLMVVRDISVQNRLDKEKLRAEFAEETNKKLELEIRDRIRTEKLLQDQYLRTIAILDSSSNTLFLTVSLDNRISSFNTHCEHYFFTHFGQQIKQGAPFDAYFGNLISPRRLRFFNLVFLELKRGKSKQFEVELEYNGRTSWLEIFMNPIFDADGNVAEISMVAHDTSEKKQTSMEIEASLKEKEVLLKEIHHRVKNNLQVISSILNLQSSFVHDKRTLEILQESRNRIRSMAVIHENLYRTADFSSINFSAYLQNLAINLLSSYSIDENVELKMDLQEVDLILDQAIPCGLLVNELITNALKYAWKPNEKGIISIELHEENKQVSLRIADDGIGLPVPFEEISTDTLGLQLVITLIEQLDGEFRVNIQNGTEYLIKFENIKPLANV